MSLYDIPITEWQESGYTISGNTNSRPLYWPRVLKVVIHYTAADKVDTNTADYLRAIQRSYVSGRGYSIGYSYAVDRDGVAWELRGTHHMPAATKNHNSNSIAILMLTNGQEPASDVMVERARDIIAEANRLAGRTLRIGGHRDYGATQCPGDGNYALIQSGAFKPVKAIINTGASLSPQDINTEEVDMRIITPKRVLDTRGGRSLNDKETIVVDAGAPGAKAVAVNLTVVDSKSGGHLTAWGAGDMPDVSNLNYPGGLVCCNTSIVPLDADGKFRIYAYAGTHVIADVQAVLS